MSDIVVPEANVIIALDFNGVVEVPPKVGPWVYLLATQAVCEGIGLDAPSQEWVRANYGLNEKPWYGHVLQLAAAFLGISAPTEREAFAGWAQNFVGEHANSFGLAAREWYRGNQHAFAGESPCLQLPDDLPTDANCYFHPDNGATWKFHDNAKSIEGSSFLNFLELVYQVKAAQLYAQYGPPVIDEALATAIALSRQTLKGDVAFVVVSTERADRIRGTLENAGLLDEFVGIHGGHIDKTDILRSFGKKARSLDGQVIFVDDQANGIGYGMKAADGLPITVVHSASGFHSQATVQIECGETGWSSIAALQELPDVVQALTQNQRNSSGNELRTDLSAQLN